MTNALRDGWDERIGTPSMKRVPAPADPTARVETGRDDAPLRTRDHAAIVYWQSGELLDAVVPYLIEGLRAGDKVVYVADETSPSTLSGALKAAGVDVDAEIARGRLTLVTAREAFFAEGRFDVEAALAGVRSLAAAAASEGYARVRFSVEMTYLLADVPGIERGPEFESRANEEVFAQFPFVCICSFNGTRDANGLLEDVLATHPILISDGIPLANPHYRPWSELAKRGRDGRERPGAHETPNTLPSPTDGA